MPLRSEATVEQLLELIPAVDELEVLRLRLIRAAVPDPGREWDSSSAYATLDKRILTSEDVEHALAEAERALREYVEFLHGGLRPVFQQYFAGEHEEAARGLVALGEQHEGAGRARSALQCYLAALRLALPLPEKRVQVLALRRLGRVTLSLGEFQDATAYYERSVELARDSGDRHGEVVARTGLGNVQLYQGRWVEAEKEYLAGLELVEAAGGEEMQLERGQLYNNLGNVTTRLNRLDEAEGWLSRGLELWRTVESPYDHGVAYLNLGHLRTSQGRAEESRQAYETGLALAVPSVLKALIAADLAEQWLLEGYLAEAEELGRVAEEHAIASGSPYSIGYMYRSRGNLARARGDEDGFTFYEKALQIAQEKGYRSLEADTLADYAQLRRRAGGSEEAEAYLERAREIYLQTGAVQSLSRVERALAELRTAGPHLAPAAD